MARRPDLSQVRRRERSHVSQQHLKRYLAEFDYRYNEREALGVSDAERMEKSVQGIVGKRLTYRRTNEARYA